MDQVSVAMDTALGGLGGHTSHWKPMGKQVALSKATACLVDGNPHASSGKMDLHCVVRRDIQYLSKRRCLFVDSPLRSWHYVDIPSDPFKAAQFAQLDKKDIATQCTACEFSVVPVSCFDDLPAITVVGLKQHSTRKGLNQMEQIKSCMRFKLFK